MKIIDISMSIHEGMQVYKNRESKKPKLILDSDHSTGSSYETRINMNMHTGTHVDAPLHMLVDGETMEVYSLDQFVGQAKVLDFSGIEARCIKRSHLEAKRIEKGDIVLLKTQNSQTNAFEFDFVYLSGNGASYLAELGVKAVGIDGLGIERDAPDHPAHSAFLTKHIPIIEGLRLAHVEEGEYEFIALPIKVDKVEAVPVRAVLIVR